MSCSVELVQLEASNVSYDVVVNATAESSLYENMQEAVYYKIIPSILFVGLVGNAINLVVFCSRISQACVDSLERSATAGLIAIALSDLLFCLVGFPAAFAPHHAFFMATRNNVVEVMGFYYNHYKSGLINLFLLSSTWLIMVISVERYLAVCQPIRARWVISLRKTVIAQCTVVVLAIVVCLPKFLKYTPENYPCHDGCTCYYLKRVKELVQGPLAVADTIIWLVGGTLIPLLVLVYCNIGLIVVLYQTQRLGIADPNRYCTRRITTVVVGIITTYFILVVPSSFIALMKHTGCDINTEPWKVATLFCNLTQAVKFAFNFILYCSINKYFRHSLGQVFRRVSTSRTMASDTTRRIDLIETSR